MAAKHPRFFKLIAYHWLNLMVAIHIVTCLPNQVRIQVSNENIQNAPYLLEAIKQAESIQNSTLSQESISSQTNWTVDANLETMESEEDHKHFGGNDTTDLTQDPPISPNVTNGSVDSAEDLSKPDMKGLKTVTVNASVLIIQPNKSKDTDSPVLGQNEHTIIAPTLQRHDRKPQLPVTTSHLKKPASGAHYDEPIRKINFNQSGEIFPNNHSSGGAKSFVSPSVSADQTVPAVTIKKKVIPGPDVLEISQIMSGVTNASAVPAIINKEYGHQTRTRITFGGGYVRDRLPPLENPASDKGGNSPPEKPLTPLERPSILKSSKKPPTVPPEEPKHKEEPGLTQAVRETTQNATQPMDFSLESSDDDPNTSANKQFLNSTISPSGKQDARCPKSGSFTLEHPSACDRYYICKDGMISEAVCPNGLMYGTRDTVKDNCVHRWKADCQDKSVPNPISSPGCRWQYGIFNVQGSPKCSPDYYECNAGKFEVKKCSVEGQIYDDRTKSCMFAELVGCINEVLADFHCPPDDQGNTYWPFPRYFFNERALIHCINDKPQIVRCTEYERVDPEHLHCVPISKLTPNNSGANTERRRSRSKNKA